jgi:glycosyltransferase involved in cell wall biosynthesis
LVTVALDYRPALFYGFGIGRYVKNLVPALLEADETLRLKLYGVFLRNRQATLKDHDWPDPTRASFHGAPLPARLIPWLAKYLPLHVGSFTGAFDLFHDTDYALLPVRRKPRVVTLYDTAYLREGEWVSGAQSEHMANIVRRQVKDGTRFLTISEFAKSELIEAFSIPESLIDVTYLGVDPMFLEEPDSRDATLLCAMGVRDPYVLYLGTLEPRKNLVRLVKAFANLQEIAPEFQLVLAGRLGFAHERIFETIESLGLMNSVLSLGRVTDKAAVALMRNASVLAYPSLYEGFGLPALEGMAAGVPVLTSDSHALREICGDGALLVNPTDDQSMVEGLRHLALDRSAAFEIADRGRERSKAFTWDRCAKGTLAAYRKAIAEAK